MKLDIKIITLLACAGASFFVLSKMPVGFQENRHKPNHNYTQEKEAVIPARFNERYSTKEYNRKIN